jgi:4-amino-4-deoxy-L-arabinose transferase-like glycosyltransferase
VRALRSVPAPLALLLGVVLVFGLMWALLKPAWAAPDEDAHFGYVASLADLGKIPGGKGSSVASDQRQSMEATNTDAVTFFPYAKPEWTKIGESDWRAANKTANRKDGGGGLNTASQYPPAYYLFADVPYKATGSSDVLTRMYAVRFTTLLWLLVTTTAAWLLAGEVFGRNRPLQLVTASVAGLWPMVTFMSSSVNPDGMLIALWALATWLGTSLLTRGPSARRAVALALCVGLAVVTKATALALVPPVLLALALSAWPLRKRISWRRVVTVGAVAMAFALPVGAWYLAAQSSGRSAFGQTTLVSAGETPTGGAGPGKASSPGIFASYLWQYYLPRLPSMTPIKNFFPTISHYAPVQVWLGSGWASFGWVNVWFPPWVYKLFFAIVVLAAAGVVASLWQRRSGRRVSPRTLRLAAFYLVMAGLLIGGLQWTDYKLYLDGKQPFLQGRYILPLAPLLALLVAQATRALPARFRPASQGVVIGGLFVFQIACLGLVAARYYG